jgi:hypothetical protein
MAIQHQPGPFDPRESAQSARRADEAMALIRSGAARTTVDAYAALLERDHAEALRMNAAGKDSRAAFIVASDHATAREAGFASGSAYFVGPARNRVTPADASTRTDADALRDTRNHHQGSGVVHAADADHARGLRRKGLIGPRGGLTRRGSIAAERLRNAALDDAFGPL